MDKSSLHFETLAVHAGLRPAADGATPTVGPITASSTFTYDSIDQVHDALAADGKGFAYGRNANPTVSALESTLARLEGADDVVAFASGMAAVHAALMALGLEHGDTVIASGDLYGATRSLLALLSSFDIQTRYVDILDSEEVHEALATPGARALYFESISNPLVRVADVAELVRQARERHIPVVVDNTFATPFLLRPLEFEADLVIHSATKYLSGHGDVVAGAVAGSQSYGNRLRQTRTASGGILSPFDAWLTLRGIRTLPLRMARQSESALDLASWLSSRPWVSRVYYPGLRSHSQHDVASRQFGGMYSGILAFDLAADQVGTLRFIDALELVVCGTSLGDVESLALYPPLSSHRALNPDELIRAGIGDSLIRLSVGLESPIDLKADLERAAASAGLAETDARTATVPGDRSG